MWLFQGCISGVGYLAPLITVYSSTVPYPHIPDKDIIVFGAELSNDNSMFPNPPKLDEIIFEQ